MDVYLFIFFFMEKTAARYNDIINCKRQDRKDKEDKLRKRFFFRDLFKNIIIRFIIFERNLKEEEKEFYFVDKRHIYLQNPNVARLTTVFF